MTSNIERAIDKLGRQFGSLDLTFHQMPNGQPGDVTSYWPGKPGEDVVVCAFKGTKIREPFHRQDFFFINYAYRNSYDALSAKFDNLITVREGECYIGQPYSGYALRGEGADEIVILGVLIRKDVFFREYLPVIYADAALFRFFIDPQTNTFSDEFIHLAIPKGHAIRTILELMAAEYANAQAGTQQILKSMLQTLLLEIARLHKLAKAPMARQSTVERILAYLDGHSDAVTLKDVATRFGYHPNYVSGLVKRETGRTFSQIVRERRMARAVLLMRNTELSLEEISTLLGYSDHSNFYKAFKAHFGTTPREFATQHADGGN